MKDKTTKELLELYYFYLHLRENLEPFDEISTTLYNKYHNYLANITHEINERMSNL